MFLTNLKACDDLKICILIFGATFLQYLKSEWSYKHKNIIS